MIIQAIKVSILILFLYLSYFSLFQYKQSLQQSQSQPYTYYKQSLKKNNEWNQQQFKSINNNLAKLQFTPNYESSTITIKLENKTDVIVNFDDLDFQYEDIREINTIQLIDHDDLVVKISSQYFILVYSISERLICYERISLYPTQEVFFVDHNKNLWVFTHPNNNMVLLRVYNRKRQQITLSKYVPKNKIQLLTQFKPNRQQKKVQLKFLTFSRNYLILTFNSLNFSLKSEQEIQSHTFDYFQNGIKQYTVGLSQKILDMQSYNLMQGFIHKLSFGFLGKIINNDNYNTRAQQSYVSSAIDPDNAAVLEFNQFYNKTELVSFGQVLIPLRTPVFINKDDQDKLITFDQALNKSRDNDDLPSVDFKLYGIKTKNLQIIKGKAGLYRLLPDAKVHFMTFDKRLLTFYPSENLNHEQYYVVRIPNGGIAMKGSQIKGLFQQLPVSNKNAVQLKYGYSKEQIYHQQTTNGLQIGQSIYEAHVIHKGLFARAYKNRVELITSLSGKSVLTHYLAIKNYYQYSTSFIQNNEFWVFQHKEDSFPIITKYELFINSSNPRTILSIKRQYEINIVARITQVQKCIDYFYYFNYITHDFKYGVARVHHVLMSNRQARSDQKYSGNFQRMMIIPSIQRNDKIYISPIQEDFLTAQFDVDPNVVKNWKNLELKHQYRVLPIRVYVFKNEYYIFDLRKLMVQAFHSEIKSTRSKFFYNSSILSVIISSIVLFVTILTSKRAQQPAEQKPKQKQVPKKEAQKEKDKKDNKDKKKKNKQE